MSDKLHNTSGEYDSQTRADNACCESILPHGADNAVERHELPRAAYTAGDEYEVRARALNSGGAGICGIDGYVVFVPGMLPGERAMVRVTETRPSYAHARITELLEPSPDRVVPDCPHFGKCGGCCFLHIPYPVELEYKRQMAADALRRIGGINGITVEPVIGAWGDGHEGFVRRYRNKGRYAFDNMQFGFYESGTHNVVPIGDCLLQKSDNQIILSAISSWLGQNPAAAGYIGGVTIRTGGAPENITVILECVAADEKNLSGQTAEIKRLFLEGAPGVGRHAGGRRMTSPKDRGGIAGCLLGRVNSLRTIVLEVQPGAGEDKHKGGGRAYKKPNVKKQSAILYGDGFMYENTGDFCFRVSHNSFFQVNTRGAEALYDIVGDFAQAGPGDLAVDFYCGVGAISIYLAKTCDAVIGVETAGCAIEDARYNAKLNDLDNLTFVEGRAETTAASLHRDKIFPGLVTLDPPRGGCGAGLIESIKKLNAGRVVYISCDPATLCRDLARFAEGAGGYRVVRVQPVDMFPGTAGIETVVLLEKG